MVGNRFQWGPNDKYSRRASKGSLRAFYLDFRNFRPARRTPANGVLPGATSGQAPSSEIPFVEKIQRTGQAAGRLEVQPAGQLVAQGDAVHRLEHPDPVDQAESFGELAAGHHAGRRAAALGTQFELLDAEVFRQAAGDRGGPGQTETECGAGRAILSSCGSLFCTHLATPADLGTDRGGPPGSDAPRTRPLLGQAQEGSAGVGFRVSGHDPQYPLTIDPLLVYSGYLGGSGEDQALGVAVDPSGNVYVQDANNVRVRRISAETGTVSHWVGNGEVFGGIVNEQMRDGLHHSQRLTHCKF